MSFDMTEIEKLIDDHMDNQPYSIDCDACGNKLDVADTTYDSDKDLALIV
ncbi:unnamed protein product, partial [marine sediment metagenome]